MASLVQNVYDHKRNPEAAGSSWVPRHFQVKELLKGKGKTGVFGVVYEFKPPPTPSASPANAPTYVIALRGARLTVMRDILQISRICVARLHRSSRFRLVRKAVWKYTRNHPADGGPPKTVWITGHSLGASVATLVGKWMAKNMDVFGNTHETFLFNPPILSLPISKIKHKEVRKIFHSGNSFLTAAFAKVMQHVDSRQGGRKFDDDDDDDDDDDEEEGKGEEAEKEKEKHVERFANNLASWVPHLFLNPADPFSSEYISYFERREVMKKIGAAKIEIVASQNSKRDLISKFLRIDSDPFHLLPSAKLIINESGSQGFPEDHELEQWWQPDLKLECKEFLWKDLS